MYLSHLSIHPSIYLSIYLSIYISHISHISYLSICQCIFIYVYIPTIYLSDISTSPIYLSSTCQGGGDSYTESNDDLGEVLYSKDHNGLGRNKRRWERPVPIPNPNGGYLESPAAAASAKSMASSTPHKEESHVSLTGTKTIAEVPKGEVDEESKPKEEKREESGMTLLSLFFDKTLCSGMLLT